MRSLRLETLVGVYNLTVHAPGEPRTPSVAPGLQNQRRKGARKNDRALLITAFSWAFEAIRLSRPPIPRASPVRAGSSSSGTPSSGKITRHLGGEVWAGHRTGG